MSTPSTPPAEVLSKAKSLLSALQSSSDRARRRALFLDLGELSDTRETDVLIGLFNTEGLVNIAIAEGGMGAWRTLANLSRSEENIAAFGKTKCLDVAWTYLRENDVKDEVVRPQVWRLVRNLGAHTETLSMFFEDSKLASKEIVLKEIEKGMTQAQHETWTFLGNLVGRQREIASKLYDDLGNTFVPDYCFKAVEPSAPPLVQSAAWRFMGLVCSQPSVAALVYSSCPKLVNTLAIDAAKNGASAEVKKTAWDFYVKMISVAREDLFNHPMLIKETALQTVEFDKDETVRCAAWTFLYYLARDKNILAKVYDIPRLVEPLMMNVLAGQGPKSERLIVSEMLETMTYDDSTALKMFEIPKLFDEIFPNMIATGGEELRYQVWYISSRLACVNTTMRARLFEETKLVHDLALKSSIHETSLQARGQCWEFLRVVSAGNDKMQDIPGIFDVYAQHAIQNRDMGVLGMLFIVSRTVKDKSIFVKWISFFIETLSSENALATVQSWALLQMIRTAETISKHDEIRVACVKSVNDALVKLESTTTSHVKCALDYLTKLCMIDNSLLGVIGNENPSIVAALVRFANDSNQSTAEKERVWEMLWNLSWPEPSHALFYDTPGLVDTAVDVLIQESSTAQERKCAFAVFQNITSSTEVARKLQSNKRVEEVLVKESMKENPSTPGIMALANIMDEDQIKTLKIDVNTIFAIADVLPKAIAGDMWQLYEPLVSLRKLVSSDVNRTALYKNKPDLLGNLIKAASLAHSKKDSNSLVYALNCLAYFAFDVDPAKWMRGNEDVQALIKLIKTAGDADQNVQSALQTLEFKLYGEENLLNSKTTAVSDENKVMISYAWGKPPHANMDLAKRVDEYISARGFSVWRDVNNDAMKGNILDSMAEAVHGANAILVLVTRTYKESINCKAEFTFARKLKKKIVPLLAEEGYDFEMDGWLGLALAGTLYYSATNLPSLSNALNDMIAKEFASQKSRRVSLSKLPPQEQQRRLSISSSKSNFTTSGTPRSARTKRGPIPNSPDQVSAWLGETGLSDLASFLIREEVVSALDLEELHKLRVKDVKDLLGLTAGKVMKLKKQLKELFDDDQGGE